MTLGHFSITVTHWTIDSKSLAGKDCSLHNWSTYLPMTEYITLDIWANFTQLGSSIITDLVTLRAAGVFRGHFCNRWGQKSPASKKNLFKVTEHSRQIWDQIWVLHSQLCLHAASLMRTPTWKWNTVRETPNTKWKMWPFLCIGIPGGGFGHYTIKQQLVRKAQRDWGASIKTGCRQEGKSLFKSWNRKRSKSAEWTPKA